MEPTRQDLGLLFENNPLPMWVFDVETLQFLAVNTAASRCYGYSSEELMQMTVEDIRFPEDRPALRVTLQRFKKEQHNFPRKVGRWRHRSKSGNTLYAEMIWVPIQFCDRDCILATAVEITQNNASGRATTEIQDRFSYLAQAVSDAFWDWDLRTNTVWWSNGLRALFQYTDDQVQPHINWWYQRIHPEDRERVSRGLENQFLSAKDLWQDEYRYLRADGTYATVIDRGYVLRDSIGTPYRMVGTLMDITARKKAEEQARLYTDIFQNMQMGVYVFHMEDLNDDGSFILVAANPASERITGIPSSVIVGKKVDECFPLLREGGIIAKYAEVVRTSKEIQLDDIYYGDSRIKSAHFSALFFPLPARCIGVAFENITERLQKEARFRRVENRFQLLAAVLPVGIYQNDADDRCIYVNQKLCELCGLPAEELLGHNWTRGLHPEDRRRIQSRWQSAFRRRVPFQAEFRLKHLDGNIVWTLSQAVPEYDDTGTFCGFIGSITDITERKRLENEILEISGKEQERIGQALHDRVGQHLTGIAFLAKALSQKLNARMEQEAKSAEEIATLINQAILRTRDLARMLHPVELAENGLIGAFQDLVSNAGRMFNIACRFEYDRTLTISGQVVATHLYHIAQEAITNAVKHGHATQVNVRLGRKDDTAFLMVEDNGTGLTEDSHGSQGIGLRIMKHRAAMVDGDLRVETSASGGTVVTCTFVPTQMVAGGTK